MTSEAERSEILRSWAFCSDQWLYSVCDKLAEAACISSRGSMASQAREFTWLNGCEAQWLCLISSLWAVAKANGGFCIKLARKPVCERRQRKYNNRRKAAVSNGNEKQPESYYNGVRKLCSGSATYLYRGKLCQLGCNALKFREVWVTILTDSIVTHCVGWEAEACSVMTVCQCARYWWYLFCLKWLKCEEAPLWLCLWLTTGRYDLAGADHSWVTLCLTIHTWGPGSDAVEMREADDVEGCVCYSYIPTMKANEWLFSLKIFNSLLCLK